ncbi:serine-rich adhesin for platelets isoform X3 [Neoarius graeffei]|uniref:serine-rich adhesin for platelets isoform X3 n=1 Tax=Neoarius graeffei TaxID=443677 RepID=UPI00298C6C2A|nr:serine-rich adhesin for platelets isoform X3 [Neoarius graeffei]
MIDLSYLTEEEQEVIMAVLKRDTELKKAEEERIKHLQKHDPEEDKLKYITGEWFYEVKSQRHQDRIHGSDIIMASMKQKKPMTVEILKRKQSWREQLSKINNDLMTPQPKATDNLMERRPLETQQGGLNRQRHNPFNNMLIDLDLDLTDGASLPETKNPPVEELPSLQTHEGSEMDSKTKVVDILQETTPRQKPVPKKRTKLFKLQNSAADSTSSISTQSASTISSVSTQNVSTSSSTKSPVSTQSMSTSSDSKSTLSTQSLSTNSEIRPLPTKGILKHGSSCSSSDSNIKRQLPQPLKSLSMVSAKTSPEQILEGTAITQGRIKEFSFNLKDKDPTSPLKTTFPKSRLPVRSSLLLNSPTQTAQEKPTIQPRLSLSSSTRSNDDKKTDILDTKQKYENNLNWPISAEPEKQNIADCIMKEPLFVPRTRSRSPFESLLTKPLNEDTTPQISPKNLGKEDSKTSKRKHEKTEEKGDHHLSITAQPVYEVTNPTSASTKTDAFLVARGESDYRPCPFDIKMIRDTNVTTEDCKEPQILSSISPKSSEEQGNSIAKVLEWFSRSSDSSDKHDCEDIIQDLDDDFKIEDIEDEINSRPKPENNVYLVIQKDRDEDTAMNDAFLKERDFAVELNMDKNEPSINSQGVQELIGQTKPLSMEAVSSMRASIPFSLSSPQETTNKVLDPEKTSPKEKVLKTASKKEESRNADKTEIPDSKPTQHELEDLEESHSPKFASLGILWDRGTSEAPKMLVSKPNTNSEKENLDQNNIVRKVIEHEEEPPKPDIRPNYSILENKEQSHVKDIPKVEEIQSDNIAYEYLNKKEASVRDKAKDMQAPMNNINQMKAITALNTTSDKDVTKLLGQKSSSSLDFGLQIGDQSNENVGGNINSSEKGCTTAAVLKLDKKVKTEEKEPQQKPPLTSGVHSQQQNLVPLATQSRQQQDNRAERIKELKSFWERDKLQSNVYMKSTAANDKNSSATSTKLNKRFTKSEYDLRSIGTESETETANFTILSLRDRIEKTVTGEGMNSLQFKMLRDFWAGSSKQSPNFEYKTQNPLSQEVKHAKTHKGVIQAELSDAKHSLKQNVCPNQSDKGFGNDGGNALPPKTDRVLQSSLKEKTVVKDPDTGTKANLYISLTGPDVLRSSHFSQPKSGSQLSPKSPGVLNKESRQQIRSSGKGTLNGRGNSLRRAISMFAINLESQDQDLPLQSKKVSDSVLPQLGKTIECTVLPSTKTPEANLQVKKSPEITKCKHKDSERSTSGDSDSQPLARSFVPRDYQHYLGITENRGKYISPQVTEQMSELVCTSFHSGDSVRCCPEQADTPLSSAELCTRRGSLGLRPREHGREDANPEPLNRVDSLSGESANFTEVSLVHEVLRRAATRPAYHKSLEDITAAPRQTRKSKHMDDFMPSSYAISSTPSPSSSSFSDKEHLRKISKSVPSFLDNENDGDESDSECSSHSGKNWKNSSPRAKLSMATLSSMSGSIMSISSADFANVEVQGTIQFSINYIQKLREFHIFVVQCQNLAAVDVKKNRSDPYVKSYLIPDTANLGKRKTSVKKKTLNPTYNEILRYKIGMEYLKTQTLNLSVWHNDTFGRNSFLGETEIDLSDWDFGNPQINCLSLKPRTISSILPTYDRGEMRLAIRFLPHISLSKSVLGSGEIHIWVRDCKKLPLTRGVTINPYVKCFVLPDTSKKSCQKTRVVKRTASPVFNHTMVYDGFRTEDLTEACVELTVWDHDRLADHLVGGLRLGLGTGQSYGTKVDWMDSMVKEVALWQRMMDSPNEMSRGGRCMSPSDESTSEMFQDVKKAWQKIDGACPWLGVLYFLVWVPGDRLDKAIGWKNGMCKLPMPHALMQPHTIRAVHVEKTTNIPELKLFCTEEWVKIPPSWCAGLINSYRKCLVAIIAAQGGHTRS